MFWSRGLKRISLGRTWSRHRVLWLCRSKHISLGRTGSKPRCFGRAGQEVSRLVVLGQNIDFLLAPVEKYLAWLKPKCFGRAGRNVSRLVEFSRKIDVLVAPVETYLTWSNLVKT